VRAEDFEPRQRPSVVRAEGGYWAFVPPPLPPPEILDGELARRLSAADRAVGELAGVARSLPNPILLSQTLVRREAVLSSRIAGTQASLSELVLFEVERPTGSGHEDVREVLNSVRAMEHVLAPDRRLPLSLPLLREAHEILMTGVRGGYAAPGDFRRSQNWIGPAGAVIDTATYVPAPPEHLWACLDAFEKYLHSDHGLPPLLDIAAIHYQFEAIHPYVDGNGRVGRLLVVLLLVEWGLLPGPVLDLSAYIEPRREAYYGALLAVSMQGDWRGWYAFMLEVFEEQARDAVRRARRLQQLRDDYRQRVATSRASGLLPVLVDELFRIPALTIPRARELLDVTNRAAAQNVEKLVAARILRELPGARRPRLFVAAEILAAVDGRLEDDHPPATVARPSETTPLENGHDRQ